MRARLAEVGWEDLAPSAGGVGVFAILLLALANVDPAAAEVRSALLGTLGVVVAVLAGTLDLATPPAEEPQNGRTRWYDYDGSLRGM